MENIERIYSYYNEKNILVYQTIRCANKHFLQRRLENNKYIYNLNGIERVLYNLPAVIKSKAVCIVEGEKDVETLRTIDIVATTCPCGSSSWQDLYNKYFKGKDVYIIPDNDEAGDKFSKKVAIGIFSYANSIRIIKLYDLEYAEDITDWLNKGHTKEELKRLMFLYTRTIWKEDIKTFKKELNFTLQKHKKIKYSSGNTLRDKILQYPIENLIQVNRNNMAFCINHTEKIPSLWCKGNWVHCFSCGYTGNVIDVAMKIWDCSFKEAFKKLENLLNKEKNNE